METNRLMRHKGHMMDIYERPQVRGYRGPNKFIRSQMDQTLTDEGDYCTVEETVPGVWRVKTKGAVEPEKEALVDFLDVLREWGCEWMWENIKVVGGTDWIGEEIEDRSLVAVTDRSFVRELYLDICLAYFVMECKKGRGRLIGSFAEKSILSNVYIR